MYNTVTPCTVHTLTPGSTHQSDPVELNKYSGEEVVGEEVEEQP